MATKQLVFLLNRGNTHAHVDSAVLDGTEWGDEIESTVRFVDVDGKIHQLNWEGVFFVTEDDIPTPPPAPPEPEPSPPFWIVSLWFKDSTGANAFEVSEGVKDQLLDDLEGQGAEDSIVTFDTLRNYRVRFPSKSLALCTFEAQS